MCSTPMMLIRRCPLRIWFRAHLHCRGPSALLASENAGTKAMAQSERMCAILQILDEPESEDKPKPEPAPAPKPQPKKVCEFARMPTPGQRG